jgi:hypothetical protein
VWERLLTVYPHNGAALSHGAAVIAAPNV